MGLQEKKGALEICVHELQVKLTEQRTLVKEARKALQEYNQARCSMFRAILVEKKKFWCGHCSQVFESTDKSPQPVLISHHPLVAEMLATGEIRGAWLILVCLECAARLTLSGPTRFVYPVRKNDTVWEGLLGRNWYPIGIDLMDVPRPEEFPETLAHAFGIPPELTLHVPNDFSVKLEECEKE